MSSGTIHVTGAGRGPIRAPDFGCGSGKLITPAPANEVSTTSWASRRTTATGRIDAQTGEHEQANHKSSCAT
jgi:hypothetical protein